MWLWKSFLRHLTRFSYEPSDLRLRSLNIKTQEVVVFRDDKDVNIKVESVFVLCNFRAFSTNRGEKRRKTGKGEWKKFINVDRGRERNFTAVGIDNLFLLMAVAMREKEEVFFAQDVIWFSVKTATKSYARQSSNFLCSQFPVPCTNRERKIAKKNVQIFFHPCNFYALTTLKA